MPLQFSVAAASGGGFVFGSTCRAETGASTAAPPAASPAPVIGHTLPPSPITTFTNAASVWTFSAKPKRGNRHPNPSGLRIFRKPKLSFKPFLSNAAPALPDNSDLASAGAAGTAGEAPAP